MEDIDEKNLCVLRASVVLFLYLLLLNVYKNNKMKKTITSFLFVLFSASCIGQSFIFDWVKQVEGPGHDYNQSFAFDSSGNIFLTGYFQLTADFNPASTDTFNLTSAGNQDIYILKLDASGNFIWALNIGGTADDRAFSIATDANGNIYITGNFVQTVDFDPGPGVFNLSTAMWSMFVCKLDGDGNFIWAKQMTGGNSTGRSISLDNQSNILLTGSFIDTVDFNPGSATFLLVSGNAGISDAFACKLDSGGNFRWARKITSGSLYGNYGTAITSDTNGNVLAIGILNIFTNELFVCKYSASGFLNWYYGSTFTERGSAYDLTTDMAGNVYVTGSFNGSFDFDFGSGTYTLTAFGGSDAFVLAMDTYGDFIRVQQIGGIANDIGKAIDIDSADNIYITGTFLGTADFDPDTTAIYNLSAVNGADVFILSLNSAGNFNWAKELPGNSNEEVTMLKLNSTSLYISGYFDDTVDFDPDSTFYNLSSAGGYDAFLHKMSPAVTEVGETTGNSSALIYPNPAHNTFTISFNGQLTKDNGQLMIYDITGREVYRQKLHSQLSTVNCQLNAGIYFVRAMAGENIFTEKLVIE
jgi:hypothetical protein